MSSTSTTTQSSAVSSTSSTSSSSSTTSLITSSTTPATASTVVTSQPKGFVTVSPSAAGSSSAETIGLGVGLGVGILIVLLLAALVGYVFYRHRKREALSPKNDHKLSDIVTGGNTGFGPSKEEPADGEQRAELHTTYLPAELSERRKSTQPVELSASQGRFS